MSDKQNVPVYYFMGLLESGKTSVIIDFLQNNQFGKAECNLIILGEEGEEDSSTVTTPEDSKDPTYEPPKKPDDSSTTGGGTTVDTGPDPPQPEPPSSEAIRFSNTSSVGFVSLP